MTVYGTVQATVHVQCGVAYVEERDMMGGSQNSVKER